MIKLYKIAILMVFVPLNCLAQTSGLMTAIEEGDLEKVSYILSKGVDVNAGREGYDPDTPLIKAIKNNESEIVKLLLENPKIQPNKQDKWKQSPLVVASMVGNTEIVKLLLEASNLDTSVKDIFENNILMVASLYGHEKLVSLYLSLPSIEFDINEQNYAKETALILASRYGHTDVVALLLEHSGIDVNLANDFGETALIASAINANADVVKKLVNVGDIKLDAVDSYGNTASIYASKYGHTDTLNYLASISHRDHLNSKDNSGFTPLMWAIKNNNLDVAIILVRYGADVNLQDDEGNTALILSCYQINFTMVDLLFTVENIDTDIRNNLGFTALDVSNTTVDPRYGTSLRELMSDRTNFIKRQRRKKGWIGFSM